VSTLRVMISGVSKIFPTTVALYFDSSILAPLCYPSLVKNLPTIIVQSRYIE
jgi:hypothetical protein